MVKESKTDSSAAVRWQIPSMAEEGFGSSTVFTGGPIAPPTAADVERWEKAGREEGYAVGYAEGQAQASEQNAQLQARIRTMLESLANIYAAFDEQAERELVHMSVVFAQQLVRRELHTDPGELIPVVRESIGLLPSASGDIRVHIHPDDAPFVHDALRGGEFESGVKLVEDPLITRGGCKIDTDTSRIDATLENRLAALAASVLVGERDGD